MLVGAIAVFSLISGKSSQTTTTPATQELTTTPSDTAAATTTDTTVSANTSGYKDGTYTAASSYRTPETTEPISVTLTLVSGVVTDVSVTTNPQAPETRQYQGQFLAGYKQYVVGKNIDAVSVSRVSGSSLTSGGFMSALAEIKTQAKA